MTFLSPFQRSTSSSAKCPKSKDDLRSPPMPPSGGEDNKGGRSDAITAQDRYRLDPLYIENPLAPHTNVTRNCFRIYRIQRLMSDSLVNLRNAVLAVPPMPPPSPSEHSPGSATAKSVSGDGVSASKQAAPPCSEAGVGGTAMRPAPSRILHAIIAKQD